MKYVGAGAVATSLVWGSLSYAVLAQNGSRESLHF
jgi:hypothetical protein